MGTKQYMGPIHPRTKKLVGVRLAQGAAVTAYSQAGPVTGPTLSSCAVASGGKKLTIKFNSSLLSGGDLKVQEYFKGTADPESGKLTGGASMMQVLVNSTAFCMQVKTEKHHSESSITAVAVQLGVGTSSHVIAGCWDDGNGHEVEYPGSTPPPLQGIEPITTINTLHHNRTYNHYHYHQCII
jgi:hypothetical protein